LKRIKKDKNNTEKRKLNSRMLKKERKEKVRKI